MNQVDSVDILSRLMIQVEVEKSGQSMAQVD